MGIILQLKTTFVVKALKSNVKAIRRKTFFLVSFRFSLN